MTRAIGLLLSLNAASCLLFTSESARVYPMWRIAAHDAASKPLGGCARAGAWVSRSGRDGVGVVFELSGTGAPCKLDMTKLVLRIGSEIVPADRLPPSPVLTSGAHVRAYVAFPFDGLATWKDGTRSAELTLEGNADGVAIAPTTWSLAE